MGNKLSELKAAAMAATPGPWDAELNEVWVMRDGTADFMLTDIFGDNELSAEQDRANAAFIAAANPAVILALLAELEAKDKHIAELEATEIKPEGLALMSEAIGAHGYIVGCLVQGRPDLALEESRKWADAFSQAAEQLSNVEDL